MIHLKSLEIYSLSDIMLDYSLAQPDRAPIIKEFNDDGKYVWAGTALAQGFLIQSVFHQFLRTRSFSYILRAFFNPPTRKLLLHASPIRRKLQSKYPDLASYLPLLFVMSDKNVSFVPLGMMSKRSIVNNLMTERLEISFAKLYSVIIFPVNRFLMSFVSCQSPLSILVIVPTMNTSLQSLERLYFSLESQHYDNWRIIFVEGPSCDDSALTVESFSREHQKCGFTRQVSPRDRIYGAMNEGLKFRQPHEWVLFWGDDDWAASSHIFHELANHISNLTESPDLVIALSTLIYL